MAKKASLPSEDEKERPISVVIELKLSWDNLADFQQSWESTYTDYLKEYASIEKATLTIPPRQESQVVDLIDASRR